ncbi:hypothetical protein NUW58_g848 [Xylaria curta]|uniref:Uncharacterized protein n=1 Tax=Xylaria curta TaxID=42375 RepID=A0ACC1PMV1_9PEZI|nr:hypothetical protein NUW58_g848 [Xylaria curta]
MANGFQITTHVATRYVILARLSWGTALSNSTDHSVIRIYDRAADQERDSNEHLSETKITPQGRPGSRGTTTSYDFVHQFGLSGPPSVMAHNLEHHRTPRKLVLCFDGTGAWIGKPVISVGLTAQQQTTLRHAKLNLKITTISQALAKDSAVGSSFDQHVVGGYRFLMRFYSPGDEIFFFGFSRGAYVARFLAEMIDYVGLLSHGNEEMVLFAWKAFSQWQSRNHEDSPEGREKRHEMYQFMKAFRETFSRPVKRIRFLGLFDTVNSVPRFETAWMQRSKFPYTARSSAKVIRHCVSIDERRAKFRQDLIYQKKSEGRYRHHYHMLHGLHEKYRDHRHAVSGADSVDDTSRGRRTTLAPPEELAFRGHSRSASRATRSTADGPDRVLDARSDVSQAYEYDSDDDEQDIDEIWCVMTPPPPPPFKSLLSLTWLGLRKLVLFNAQESGGHGDVGGGWEILPGSKSASHVPLVYMIRQAEKAGLNFDAEKLVEMGLAEALIDANTHENANRACPNNSEVPGIRVDVSSLSLRGSPNDIRENWGDFKIQDFDDTGETRPWHFHDLIRKAHVARIHDSLEFSSGLGTIPVISWKFMEYLPFRRMDLQPDGSWKPIRWPLPAGETRDIPHTARIHGSVISRMKHDPSYRPGNLIIGGGGRGTRRAPEEHGIGEWDCVSGHGDPIEEVWVKKVASPTDK